MRFILIILIICIDNSSHSQEVFYSMGHNGELIESNSNNCSARSLGNYTVFGDIALTPDGRFYGITDRLYLIDTVSQSFSAISSQIITFSGGLGLIAYDNDILLFDKSDSLFLYNLNTNTEMLIGIVGYSCNGDYAILDNDLYMVSNVNELIKITLDVNAWSIVSVENKGVINSPTGDGFALFTAFESCFTSQKSLFVIDELDIFKVNKTNAQVVFQCTMYDQQYSYGSASFRDVQENTQKIIVPNVFTPNGDGINDTFIIDNMSEISKLDIFNRWGNLIYSWSSGPIEWKGENVSDGIYYYVLQINSCNTSQIKTGHISLFR